MATAPSNTEEFKSLLRNHVRGYYTIDPYGNIWQLQYNEYGEYWQNITQEQNRKLGEDGLRYDYEREQLIPWHVANADAIEDRKNTGSKITVGPLGGEKPEKTGNRTLRWPDDIIQKTTDYVFFQFGKYLPPFSRDAGYRELLDKKKYNLKNPFNNATTEDLYNSSNENLDVSNSGNNIVLPIPQDLSNEIQQVWQGKQFTATGRAALAALGGGNLSYAKSVVKNITGNAKAIKDSLTSTFLNSIPGVGGNISFNDVSGSTRGVVINPNAELLYEAPDMREIGMIFKLVPRNPDESLAIRNIVRTFRKAAMPAWGATGGEPMVASAGAGANQDPKKDIINYGGEDNWIRVPNLCKFSFMHGDEPHPWLIQFKPCAISRVEVNYTSDGTFATYSDGAPVAVELSLNFMETKLIFSDEVEAGY